LVINLPDLSWGTQQSNCRAVQGSATIDDAYCVTAAAAAVECRGVLFSDPIHSYRLLLLSLVLVIAARQPPLSPRQQQQQRPPALAPSHATPPTPPPDQRRQLLQLLRAAAALLLLLLRDPLSLSSASAQPPSPECPWALATLTNQQIHRQPFELDFQPL
jgi:hypothetical protein